MLYAILAYHEEHLVQALSDEEDAALMEGLKAVHGRLADRLGPAARLGATVGAATVRKGLVTDGPFAETKEQLLGLYVVDAADRDHAIAAALDLQSANPDAVYEVRPIALYLPNTPFPVTDTGLGQVRP